MHYNYLSGVYKVPVKYKDFILEYYKRKTFRDMSWPQFLQFCDDVKKDNLSKNQKLWRDHFLLRDPATGNFVQDPMGGYIRKHDPDPNISTPGEDWQLSDAEWANMYRAFRTAFRGLKSNASKFSDNTKATQFLNDYFGQNAASAHVFDEIQVNPDAITQINLLKRILTDSRTQDVVVDLYNEGKIDTKDNKLEDILDGIDSHKYEKNEDFRNKLVRIVYHIQGLLSNSFDRTLGDQIRSLNLPLNLSVIYNDFEDTSINPVCLTNFKGTYASMLERLYKEKDTRSEFAKYDEAGITQQIDSAKTYVNFNDPTNNPDDYVSPKGDDANDERNFKQKVAEWWDDTFEGYLEKYTKLRGDRMFFSDQAKEIAKAFDKLKPPVKPTDGLDKILESCDKASEKVKLRKSKAHLKWFKENLAEIKKIMPKAFEGALQHGNQMRAIVAEVIRRAVADGKTEEAKTTMELLSVMKYGMTTSKTMDALKKTDLTIFSDKNLSWNKNEGMQFVSTALDKSIKAAFIGIGYGITMIGNEIRLSGSKFNGNRGNILRQQQNREKQAAQHNTDNLNQLAQIEINNQTTNRSQSGVTDDADLANKRTISQARQNDIVNKQRQIGLDNSKIDRKNRQIQQYESLIDAEKQKPDYQHASALDEQISDLTSQIQQLNDDIQYLDNELANPIYTNAPLTPDIQEIAQELARQKAHCIIERNKLNASLARAQTNRNNPTLVASLAVINNNIAGFDHRKNVAEQYKTNYENDLATHANELQNLQNTKNALDNQISRYESATNTINELNQQIQNRNNEMHNWDQNHHDKYKELMAYWDMLETGRDSHTGVMYKWMPGHKKSHQARFDASKAQMIQAYMNNYTIAA